MKAIVTFVGRLKLPLTEGELDSYNKEMGYNWNGTHQILECDIDEEASNDTALSLTWDGLKFTVHRELVATIRKV